VSGARCQRTQRAWGAGLSGAHGAAWPLRAHMPMSTAASCPHEVRCRHVACSVPAYLQLLFEMQWLDQCCNLHGGLTAAAQARCRCARPAVAAILKARLMEAMQPRLQETSRCEQVWEAGQGRAGSKRGRRGRRRRTEGRGCKGQSRGCVDSVKGAVCAVAVLRMEVNAPMPMPCCGPGPCQGAPRRCRRCAGHAAAQLMLLHLQPCTPWPCHCNGLAHSNQPLPCPYPQPLPCPCPLRLPTRTSRHRRKRAAPSLPPAAAAAGNGGGGTGVDLKHLQV
jgi:hypothetical protein